MRACLPLPNNFNCNMLSDADQMKKEQIYLISKVSYLHQKCKSICQMKLGWCIKIAAVNFDIFLNCLDWQCAFSCGSLVG